MKRWNVILFKNKFLFYESTFSTGSTTTFFSYIMNAFLVEISIDISMSKVATSCLDNCILLTTLDEEGINTLAIIRRYIARIKSSFYVMVPIKVCTT